MLKQNSENRMKALRKLHRPCNSTISFFNRFISSSSSLKAHKSNHHHRQQTQSLLKHPSNHRISRQAHAQLIVRGSLIHDADSQFPIFNAILRLYSIGERPEEALYLYKQFQPEIDHIYFNSFSYSFLVKACANSRNSVTGFQVHARIAKVGFDSHVYVLTSLLNFYLVCGSLEGAHQVFDEMPERNLVSWNVMITGLIARREIKAAEILFNSMPRRNVVSWTGMIDGHTRAENYSKAFSLFQEMAKIGGIMPTGITLLTIFPAVANLGDIINCKSLHCYGDKRALLVDIRLANSLIDTYSKCGCIDSALRAFDEISENKRNLISWTSMISGFTMHGMAKEAAETFQRMESDDKLKPNQVTFLCILSGCSHSGLVEEGLEFFRKMRDDYRLLPGIKHYGCIVDLLGRAGRLEEAENLAIETFDEIEDVVVWRTLLGACSFHGNADVAERVARKIQEIERGYGGDYVLLSNILTSHGKFCDSEKVRRVIDDGNVYKIPGLSLV